MPKNQDVVILTGEKSTLSPLAKGPAFAYNERLLGFETEYRFFEGGLPASAITFSKTKNTRKTEPYINQFIQAEWNKVVEKAKATGGKAFDAPRARYEGSMFDHQNQHLTVLWSEDRYSTHGAIRGTILPREYQANLFTINGIPLPKDGVVPILLRNPNATDQGRIEHIAPAGFINLKGSKGPIVPEGIDEAVTRLLFNELHIPDGPYYLESPHEATKRELNEEIEYPVAAYVPEDMSVIGIAYNYRKNFDYEAAVVIPLNCDSSEIKPKGKEHEKDALRWVSTSRESLKNTLFELSFAPDNNSGHLRADVALLIGHLYGAREYENALNEVVLELAKMTEKK
jgi:hypothetical protein